MAGPKKKKKLKERTKLQLSLSKKALSGLVKSAFDPRLSKEERKRMREDAEAKMKKAENIPLELNPPKTKVGKFIKKEFGIRVPGLYKGGLTKKPKRAKRGY